jgi:hypothetical protein
MISIMPFEPLHYALLPVRKEQAGEPELLGSMATIAAEHGPAFSAVETDDRGNLIAVLACGGLAETSPDHATAWAAFAEGLRAGQWSPVIAAVRAVIDGTRYGRIDMCVRADWPTARRFAEALGFKEEFVTYSRAGGEA